MDVAMMKVIPKAVPGLKVVVSKPKAWSVMVLWMIRMISGPEEWKGTNRRVRFGEARLAVKLMKRNSRGGETRPLGGHRAQTWGRSLANSTSGWQGEMIACRTCNSNQLSYLT